MGIKESRIPSQINSSTLLFQGSLDIIINKIKGLRKEGICFVNNDRDEEMTEETTEGIREMDDDNSSQDSQDSGRIQIAHQMTDVKSFTGDGSFIPEKAGELVAALHNQLACRTLRRLVMGKEFRYTNCTWFVYT